MNGFVYFEHVTQTMFLVYLNFFLMASNKESHANADRLYKFAAPTAHPPLRPLRTHPLCGSPRWVNI